MKLTLAELRAKQKAEGVSEPNPGVSSPAITPAIVAVSPTGQATGQAAPAPVTAGGYCRIFPATFPSVAEIPDDWKHVFWSVPSPWCALEGFPLHPEFEANLAAFEKAL